MPSGSITDCKSQEDSRSSVFTKLALLEKLHKSDQLRIEQLEKQVKDLQVQLENMKQANKTLLEEKGFAGGELHALYQNLFITDMKQQMTDMSNDVTRFRSQKEQLRKEYESLKKENGQLLATVKRYRLILSNSLKKNGPTSVESVDASSIMSGLLSDSDKTQGRLSEFSKKRISIESNNYNARGLRINMVSMGKIEKLNVVLLQLCNCANANQLCKIMTRSAKTLTKSQRVSVYVVSSKAKDNYVNTYPGSPDFIGRVRLGSSWMIMHTHKEAYQEEPMFKKFDELKYPVRHSDLLLMPIIHDKDLSFIIQVQEKLQKHKSFTPTDELLLKLISNAITIKLSSIFASEQESQELARSSQIASIASQITSSLSHRDIANRIRSALPNFFGFENAGIVFVDSKSHQFCVMTHDPSSQDYFGDGCLRFPFGTGLTGQAVSRDSISVFTNPKTMAVYNPEVDNVGWVNETKVIIMGALKDWSGNLVGVIQLTNKKYGDVDGKDVKRLESLLGLLGTCVAATNLTVEHFSLTIKFKAVMDKITKLVRESDKNSGEAELNAVFNQITYLKNSFGELVKTRKMRII